MVGLVSLKSKLFNESFFYAESIIFSLNNYTKVEKYVYENVFTRIV